MSDDYNPSFKKYLLDLVDNAHGVDEDKDGKKKKKKKAKNRDKDLPLGILKYLRISNAGDA